MISAFGVEHGEVSKSYLGSWEDMAQASRATKRGTKIFRKKSKATPARQQPVSPRRGITAMDYEDGVMHVPDSLKGM